MDIRTLGAPIMKSFSLVENTFVYVGDYWWNYPYTELYKMPYFQFKTERNT